MAKISDVKGGEQNLCYHQNSEEMSSGELRCIGLCNPIGMDIFEMLDKRHGICVCRSVEASSGNLFASFFLWKIQTSSTYCRNLKYDYVQEIRPRSTRPVA